MGEYLTLENDSGTYKFDDAGLYASNGVNKVKIQPNNSGELFSIYKGNKKNFYVDASGNLHFEGDLTGATGTFSGLLSGGSININDNFTVDSSGNMVANNGTLKGTINSSVINGSTITGGIVNGASIISAGSNGTTTINGGAVNLQSIGKSTGILTATTADGTCHATLQPSGVSAISTSNMALYQDEFLQLYNMSTGKETRITPENVSTSSLDLSDFSGTYIYKCNGEYDGGLGRGIPSIYYLKNYFGTFSMKAEYTASTGGYGGGGQLIKFSNAESGYLTAATAQYVQNYVQNYVNEKSKSFYNAGYSKGLSDGENIGYNKGYSAGKSAGYSSGYNKGYAAGLKAGSKK